MKGRRIWTGIILTVAVLLASLFVIWQRGGSPQGQSTSARRATLPAGVVEVSPERQQKMDLLVSSAVVTSVRSRLRLTGEIASVPGTQVHVTSPVSGRLVAATGSEALTIGSRVEKGQVLTVVESFPTGSAGLTAEAQLKQEEAYYAKAQADWERAQRLYANGLIALKDLQQAEAEYQAAKGRLEALRQQYQLFRATQLSRGEETEPGRFWVRAPISGVITTWNIAPGQTVAADETLATITSISSVIAEANLFVDDLSRVRVGQQGVCTTEAYPDESFRGQVSYIGPLTEPGTRVLPVHVRLPNPYGKLKIGMPVEVWIESGPARQAVVVPREAVIFEEGLHVVYVQVASDQFERRVVRLGEATETGFEIRDGLRPGEKLVVRGSFLIKAESLKGILPPPAEAGEAQRQ